jgi:hypothetical protein
MLFVAVSLVCSGMLALGARAAYPWSLLLLLLLVLVELLLVLTLMLMVLLLLLQAPLRMMLCWRLWCCWGHWQAGRRETGSWPTADW